MNKLVQIGDFADMLHPMASRWRALALLRAYFDESGTHGGLVTSIGGFIASKESWVQFELDLATVLAPYADKGVYDFHMTNCLAQKEQFSAIETPFINSILWGIGKALNKANVTAIYAGVVQKDWDSVVTNSPFKQRFPKPFYLCFEEVLRQLAMWSQKHGDGEPVAPIFAKQDEYQVHMGEVGECIDRSGKYKNLLTSITFGKPSMIKPLQAADFAAHQMNGNINSLAYWKGLDNAGPTRVFDRATSSKYSHGGWYDKSALQTVMKRFATTGEI